nr:sphingomyelin phosphodiesterase-like [Onthophagus taurus]
MLKLFLLIFLVTQVITANINKDEIRNRIFSGIHHYAKTGEKSLDFSDFLNSYSFKHAFRQRPKHFVNYESLCDLCVPIVDAAIEERRNGLDAEDLVTMIVDLCVSMNIESKEVCEGAIKANADPVIFIVDNKPDLSGSRVCGTVLQGSGCKSDSIPEWDIKIPEGTTIDVEKGLQSDSKPLKVLQITDIHYDPNYLPGSPANCQEPLCCQSDKGLAENEDDAAGYWGDYRDCDSPRHVVIDAYEHINRVHDDIDYIYFTGDIIRHKVWNTSVESNLKEIQTMFDDFEAHFPNIPIFSIFGNHEPHPVNVYAPSVITDSLVSTQWLYNQAANLWGKYLPEEAQETIKKGGYYTTLIKPGLRIIGINSNIYYIQNWWLLYDNTQQIEQLQWLSDTLYEAEKNNEFVHILSHLPSGGGSAILSYSKAYRRILERFSNTITAIFQGHTHHDQWVIFHHIEDNSPIGIVWDGGSLTTASNLNYNYKIYDVDQENFEVLDFESWTFNLTEANLTPNLSPNWFKQYSFKEAFGLDNASPKSVKNLMYKMAQNHDLLQIEYRHRYREADSRGACDENCMKNNLCDMTKNEYGDDYACQELLSTWVN